MNDVQPCSHEWVILAFDLQREIVIELQRCRLCRRERYHSRPQYVPDKETPRDEAR